MRRPQGFADWFAYGYLVFVALVMVANIVVHVVGPW